ncbi:rna polymerase sigma70 : RNA polymerase sigma factor, sigma-70 family OS=Desulfovibrio alaskensis (strain G20) GN=Dde_0900 PE=4 SV=1: Sigma70_r2 [Gemmataceae bacterium]|nr:rna polymerase sigma70 : RNA polymerase sigma factor, sigma-70 family OS=Desulfovibrio alaskensis (strain G20) GN=Dde_0900 PE=4 SV=1: Sigma70_r2 [Gemmataceae bacterium]VTU02519.1 rna polymerase sigma70 : RNA polymerase sigma factor, sigma-70 family OS=Desulfovibrio alaskensis (strain G20) GN=Dde_0900 PE=4 SV=1: Sigma70_r2 [Gemmataceae bacterium]
MPHATGGPAAAPTDPAVAALIRRKARRLVGRAGLGPQDAADLEQELHARLLAQRHRFDPARGTWAAFAHRLVDRCAANLVRDRRAAKRGRGRARPLTADVPAPAPADSGDGGADELAAAVARAVAALPPRLRAVAELLLVTHVAGAARALGVSRSTVYARLAEIGARHEFADLARFRGKGPTVPDRPV